MATPIDLHNLLLAIQHCMTECQVKANDDRLPPVGKNVFILANMQFLEVAGKLYRSNPENLKLDLINVAIIETNQATDAVRNSFDQNSVGFAAIQLGEAITACNRVLI